MEEQGIIEHLEDLIISIEEEIINKELSMLEDYLEELIIEHY